MRFFLCLCLVFASCSATEPTLGYRGGFNAVELAVTEPAKEPGKSLGGRRDDGASIEAIFGLSALLIDEGLFRGGLGPGAEIPYSELKLLAARERSDDERGEALGLGTELNLQITQSTFTRLGYWVLKEGEVGAGDGAEIGRLTFGVGYFFPLSNSTHISTSLGLEWERDRKGSVNFFSLASEGHEGLFGSKGSAFGWDLDLSLRHRLGKYLELDAGLRLETLREDSAGFFGSVRFFMTPNLAIYFDYEDVDEPTARVGISILGS
jgi:hypothetical protein